MLSPPTPPLAGSSLGSEVVLRRYRSLVLRIGRTRKPYLQYGLYGTIEHQNKYSLDGMAISQVFPSALRT
jgi:hypothetical protein